MQQLIVWASLQQFHNQTPGAGDCKGVKIVKEKTILGYLGPVVLLQTTSTTLLLGRRQSLPSQIKSVEAPEKKVFTAVIQLSLRNRNCVSQTLREALICETLQSPELLSPLVPLVNELSITCFPQSFDPPNGPWTASIATQQCRWFPMQGQWLQDIGVPGAETPTPVFKIPFGLLTENSKLT